MGTLKGSLGNVPTSQHWTAIRTDDDIQTAVSQFLEVESGNLKTKPFSDSIVDVSRWLGSQIQKERDGWAFKVRMAMQEIESQRRETLKVTGLLQDCSDQLRMIAGCSNIEEETLDKIAQEEPKRALPMYIECISVLLNDLVEDRLQCLHVMKKKETDGATISQILHAYIHKLQTSHDAMKRDLAEKVNDLEMEVFKLGKENAKLKRLVAKKNEEIEQLHSLLQKSDQHIEFDRVHRSTNTDHGHSHHPNLERSTDRSGSPGSMKSAPTPVSMNDANHIHISEEKLHKLRKSAKKLENSLQDALHQMDSYRNLGKGATMKYSHASMISNSMRLKPLHVSVDQESEVEVTPREKKTGLVKSQSLRTTKFEISGKANQSVAQSKNKADKSQSDQTTAARRLNKLSKSLDPSSERQHGSEERERAFARSERMFANQSQQSCTFKSLVRSLDEMRTRRHHSVKGGKVSKCLRCQKLFTLQDNHKKACLFHPRMKERVEEYSSKGRLQRVTYVWQCCQQGTESQGCCYGQHI